MERRTDRKVLLLGGEGFLGKGLQDEFLARCVPFRSVDAVNLDLSSWRCIQPLADIMADGFTDVVLLAGMSGRDAFAAEPERWAAYNDRILQDVASAMYGAGRRFALTYYSTPEVLG